MFKNKTIRNWSIIIIVAVVAVLAVQSFSSANAGEAIVSTEGEVVSLPVAETIEASGSLEAQPFAALDWKTNGVVEKVNVQPGDLVKAGDVLLTLQPASTTASIVSAQADLINAQEKLADLMTSRTSLAEQA
jgi:membrane fusion protein, multidrug efflux system